MISPQHNPTSEPETEALAFPSAADLVAQIQFDFDQGKIWFQEQRMLLVHAAVMGELRKGLIHSLGVERASSFLLRFGYQSGWRDAQMARALRPEMTVAEAFFAGPQLHGIKGMVKVSPVAFEFDPDTEHFYSEFLWHGSYEAEQHIAEFGIATDPICWTLIGYASGYATYFCGRPILFREVNCEGCGDSHCTIIGKPASEWPDRDRIERWLTPEPIADELMSLQQQLDSLKASFRSHELVDDFLLNSVGRSEPFKQVCQLIKKASQSKATVLIRGETGVGKEIVARGLHAASERTDKAFVAVNCACIPPDLIESELFGVEKGAYTGATTSREGRFERAHKGTIFLDEVIELSPRAQASLLRVLQESEIERVGGTHTRKIDVRVVAATNEDLETAVAEGRFRADLFFRLNVLPVRIPPLRERFDDIPLLVDHFLEKYCTLYGKNITGISDKALEALLRYKWPGNIRELENMIERGVILANNGQAIELHSLFPSLSEPSHPLNVIGKDGMLSPLGGPMMRPDSPTVDVDHLLDQGISLDILEQEMIQRAMQRSDGNVTHAARLLGLTRPALAYRLKKLNIE